MQTLTSAKVQANFGQAIDIAKAGEALTITQYGRPTAMMFSFKEGSELIRLRDVARLNGYFTARQDSVLQDVPELSMDDINKLVHELRPQQVVIDSNILVSAAIYPHSASANALRLAVMFCELYRSDETTAEIEPVLLRSKFDRYFAAGGPSREDFLTIYKDAAALEPITEIATDCSDPKDNKFLSLALSVKVDFQVTGDRKHLISMHPYRGIPIVSEADFVQLMLNDLTPNVEAKT